MSERKLFADLGAQRIVAAQKGAQKIAVEIKNFRRVSTIEDLQEAVWQAEVKRQLRPSRPGVIGRTRPDFLDTMFGIHADSPAFAEVMREIEETRAREEALGQTTDESV